MKTLIIGAGEIGNSLFEVLSENYECDIVDKFPKHDKGNEINGTFEIIHICFPYSEEFINQVREYQKVYIPKYTVIHATVPTGTSTEVGAIHSPIVGIHPHLKESIKTFTKFLGGENASEVGDYFRRAGIKVYLFDKAETTELMKIMSTTFYALMIEYTKGIKRLCKTYEVPFEAWTLWTKNYNEGYTKLGYPEYNRPNLVPIMTGQHGHCTQSNSVMLHQSMEIGESFKQMIETIMAGGSIPQTQNPLNDRTWLYCEYWGKKKSAREIGEELGCSETNVFNFMKKFEIPRKDGKWKEEDVQKLIELHKQDKTFKEIADELNKTYESVRSHVYGKTDLKSKYNPGKETKKLKVRKKISQTLSGETEQTWNGFRNTREEKIVKNMDEFNNWKKEILKRDNYQCVECKEVEGLHVHHIKRLLEIINEFNIQTTEDARNCKILWDINNGKTLCIKCHNKEHQKLRTNSS